MTLYEIAEKLKEHAQAHIEHDRFDQKHREALHVGCEHRKRQDAQIRDLKDRVATLEEALELVLTMVADIHSAIDKND